MAGAATDGSLDARRFRRVTNKSAECVGVRVDFAAWPDVYPVSVGGYRTVTAARSVVPCQVQISRDRWVKTEGRTVRQLAERGWLIHQRPSCGRAASF